MKTYWIVVLTVYITWLTTLMVGKVGEMSSPPSINTWTLPAMALFLTVVPALLGYLIGKEQA
jgi:hypothetical protein